jgi:hypothetical protein
MIEPLPSELRIGDNSRDLRLLCNALRRATDQLRRESEKHETAIREIRGETTRRGTGEGGDTCSRWG